LDAENARMQHAIVWFRVHLKIINKQRQTKSA